MDTQHATKWGSVNDLAAHFGISRKTVYRWLEAGCPSHRPAGRLIFDLEEVEAWVRSRCSSPTPGEVAAA